MINLNITKNELELFQEDAKLTLPPITITCLKADSDDLEYQIRSEFRDLVEEIVQKQIKGEF